LVLGDLVATAPLATKEEDDDILVLGDLVATAPLATKEEDDDITRDMRGRLVTSRGI